MKIFLLLFILLPQLIFAQLIAITGTVRDAQHQPVPFAGVGVVGTTLGATADEAGHYALANVPTGPVRLRASAVGFTPIEQRTSGPTGQPRTVDFVLRATAADLGEVVVTGVGRATLAKGTGRRCSSRTVPATVPVWAHRRWGPSSSSSKAIFILPTCIFFLNQAPLTGWWRFARAKTHSAR